MEIKKCGSLLTHRIYKKGLYKKGNHIYKYSPKSEAQLKVIDSGGRLLTKELYGLPDQLLYTSKDNYLGCRVENYRKMKAFYSIYQEDINIDKLEFFRKLITVLTEIESLGLSYWDIHPGNFLIDENNNFKVIDLDSVEFTTDKSRITVDYNLMTMVIDSYFYRKPLTFRSLERFLDRSTVCEFLPNDIYEYLDYVSGLAVDMSSVDRFEIIKRIDEFAPTLLRKR